MSIARRSSRGWRAAAGALLIGTVVAPVATPASAHPTQSRPSATPAAPPARPHAWILVDAGRGVVLDAGNDRLPLPPASLTKVLTAVIATSQLAPTDTLTVSDRAAGEPATKINMKPGQVWSFQDALYALLLSSANDAAVAIGERVGGSLDGFAAEMKRAGTDLGLADEPKLDDPAGLDDSFSVDGGNLVSARDLAIIARTALAQPLIAEVVGTPVYRFVGPDGAHHRLGNHNQLLKRYPGAIGVKTGYTTKAGENLMAAAQRGSRTMLAVVMGAPNLYADAAALLDEGFATSSTSSGTGDVLPPRSLPETTQFAPPTPSLAAGARIPAVTTHGSGGGSRLLLGLAALLLTLTLAGALRRRQVSRRRARRRAARAR